MSASGIVRNLLRRALLRRPTVPVGERLPRAEFGTVPSVTFLGNTTLLFDDGATQLITDGFFSRPGILRTVIGTVDSDPEVVRQCLDRAGATRLAAVFVLHSHYDHLLDAPTVALSSGASLLGSLSSVMAGRGAGVPESRLLAVSEGQRYEFGRFTITPVVSGHVPPPRLAGVIDRPLRPPAAVSAYRMATCYSLIVQHGTRTVLVQGSAGTGPADFTGSPADVVYLAVGALGRQPVEYQDAYWDTVVVGSAARRVIPTHWDDFSRPLSRPLRPLPYLVDDISLTMDFLRRRAGHAGVDIRVPDPWIAADPFAGL